MTEFKVPESKVGLIINVVKYKTYFETDIKTFECNSLKDAKIKLVNYLTDIYKHLVIDFPENMLDFEYIWFHEQYVKANAFNYKIYHNHKWSEPWELQNIYDSVLDTINKLDINADIDYGELYDEPSLDELYEKPVDNKGFYSNDGHNIDDDEIDDNMEKDEDELVV